MKKAALRPILGRDKVLRFLAGGHRPAGRTRSAVPSTARPALCVLIDGELDTIVTFLVEDGLVTGMYVVRNPEKLARLAEPVSARRRLIPPTRRTVRGARVVEWGHKTGEPRAGLRVRTSRRPSEPDPVSTGEGSQSMASIRARLARPSGGRRRARRGRARGVLAGRRRRPVRGQQGRRPGHPRLVRAAQAADRAVRAAVRLPPRRPRGRRRRHPHQQAGAHPGRPDRRRRVRRRQHLRQPRARRRRLRAVPTSGSPPAPSSTSCPATTHRLAPIDNGNVCVNVDTTLVRRPPPRRRRGRSTTW